MFIKNIFPRHVGQSGFIALTAILITSVVALAITVSLSLISIGQGQAALSQSSGESTIAFIDGCAEDALLKLRASAAYAGGTITRPEGTCSITVSSVSTTYTLTVTTTATTYRRTVQIVAVRASNITISSWKEI